MSTVYCQQADLALYIEGFTVTNPAAADRLIERCQRDIDAAVGPLRPFSATGLKFDPTTLDANDAAALTRATVAQCEYRMEMGEDFFVRPQTNDAERAPRIGPKVWVELQSSRLLRLTTRTTDRHQGRPGWYSFAYNEDP